MPSWKKIILSGSDAALNTLNVTNSITASVISASQFTGSLFGTSSWANDVVSASHASTASYVNPLRQNVLITGSLSVSGSITSSNGIVIGRSGSSGDLTIWKKSNGEAVISFPNSFPQNDIGWIKHIESTQDVGRMEFRVGDNALADPDEFWFGSSLDPDIITLRTNGDVIQRTGSLFIQSGSLFLTGSARITGSIILTGSLTASGDISIRDFPSVSASLASLASGVGTLQQVTDAGNTTTNAISSSFPGVGFYGTASWAMNVVNGGGGGGGGVAYHTQTLADVTWSFAHNLGIERPVITVYDDANQVIIPEEIDGVDSNNIEIYFPISQSGYATAVGGVGGGSTNTGSLLTTASVNLNTITFTKGSGTTFNITVDTGSGGGGGGVTINNNVDNYIITATGTANTLNGEVDLQYSSSILINRGRSLFTYSGLGVTNTTHYFRATGSDTNAGFLIADKDGEDLFKVAGSIADSDSLITIGDVGNAANATKIEVNNATNYINLQGVTRANQIATEATALTAAGEFDIGSRIARDWSATGPALIAGRIVYLSGSTEWAPAQANTSGSSYGMLGVVINTESQREILIEGTIQISGSALSSGIAGQPVYLSAATAGQVTLTPPSTSGQVVRIIGYITKANSNIMYFRPDISYAIVT